MTQCHGCGEITVEASAWLSRDAIRVGDSLDYGRRQSTESETRPKTWVCSTACADRVRREGR
jgi:hypothetical protein